MRMLNPRRNEYVMDPACGSAGFLYDLTAEDLADTSKIPDEKLGVAEAFVRFAQEQGFDFWEVDQ